MLKEMNYHSWRNVYVRSTLFNRCHAEYKAKVGPYKLANVGPTLLARCCLLYHANVGLYQSANIGPTLR